MAQKTVTVARHFILNRDDGTSQKFEPGRQVMDKKDADHWFTKAHLEEEVLTDEEREARRVAEAARAEKEAEAERKATEAAEAKAAKDAEAEAKKVAEAKAKADAAEAKADAASAKQTPEQKAADAASTSGRGRSNG